MEILAKEGAKFVLNSSEEGFDQKLKELASAHDARIAFDAIGGETTGRILAALPNGSTCYTYGALDGKPCSVHPGLLIS